MQRINLLSPTIRRSSRKIGRNEPCPCGRMRETAAIDPEHLSSAVFSQEPDKDGKMFTVTKVPVKYKHCHGDIDNQRKATKIQNYLKRHFVEMLNRPRTVGKLRLVADKIKSLFSKKSTGRK